MQVELTSDALTFTGELNHHTVPDVAKEISKLLKGGTISKIDLGELTMIDSAGVAFLDEMHLKLTKDSKQQIFQKVPAKIQAMIDTYSTLDLPLVDKPPKMGFFEQVGDSLLNAYNELVKALTLAAEIFYYSGVGIFNRKEQRRGSLLQQATQLGADALPIVALLSLIIGFILALQSGVQLKNFGTTT